MMKSLISNSMNFYPILMSLLIMLIMLIPMKNKFHPMMLMSMLIILTIFITNKMNYMIKSWMPMILFLVMIGGLMIIFMYITSLANNELFMYKFKNLMILLLKLIMTITIIKLLINNKMENMFWNSQDSWNFIINLEKKNNLNFKEIFSLNNYSMMFLMNYLFLSMMCIMNICYKFKSPLRQLYLYE